MTTEELWQQMEEEVRSGSPAAWLTRYALPQPSQPLLIALEATSNRRALLLPLPRTAIPSRREWPECRGLEVFSVGLVGQPHLGVRLREPAYADVFAALAEDVAPRVAAASSPVEAGEVMLSRLRRWQKFLSAAASGLPIERQRGLHGELQVLRSHLIPALGAAAAVAGWRAPRAAHQDFQYPTGAVEVKATTAKQPQSVRITSERQLDDTGIPALFLHVVVLDERELEGPEPLTGESLPDVVRGLRAQLQGELAAQEAFEDRLLETGYLEADAPRYEGLRRTLRTECVFRVSGSFPRVTERDLPSGVGGVTYDLSLAACQAHSTDPKGMIHMLGALAESDSEDPNAR